jgi:hypothetical protein
MKLLQITTFLFALMLSSHAKDPLSLFDHENPGCPENSTCSKEMGLFYERWTKTITKKEKALNNFLRAEGMPFSVWTRPTTNKAKKWLIEWDSPCSNHRDADNKRLFNTSYIKVKNLKNFKDQKEYVIREIIRQNASKVVIYKAPRHDLPSYTDGENLIYDQFHEGHYYTLKINDQGKLSIVGKRTYKSSRHKDCTPELIKAFRSRNYPKGLYQYHSCRKLWDVKTKTWQNIIYGKACS